MENLENIKGGVIFASNHISELDPILIPAAFPFFSRFSPMFYVSREKTFYNIDKILKKIFYGGFFFKLWGAFPTHAGLNNYDVSLQTHVTILKEGHSLSIFPEGDKSFDNILREGKGGATFLAHKAGVPIVPVAIIGAYKSSPMSLLTFKKKITITFGEPIYPKELFSDKNVVEPQDYKMAVNQVVMARIRNMLTKKVRSSFNAQNQMLEKL